MMKHMCRLSVILFVVGWMGVIGASANDGAAQETPVTLDGGIQGIFAEPQHDEAVPAVLLLHGFASQKDEVGDMYKRLAAALAEAGIASLRIDFRGWGESAGQMTASSVHGQVEDAATAYDYLRSLDAVNAERIGVVGFSLGGGIAIVSAAQEPQRYASMVLWSSVGDFKADFLDSLGQENFDRAAQDGEVTIDLGWRDVTLGNEFFTSLDAYDLPAELSKYPAAFFTITGSEDFSSAYSDGYMKVLAGDAPKKALTIEGADHIFGVLGEDQSMAEHVISETVQWFKETL